MTPRSAGVQVAALAALSWIAACRVTPSPTPAPVADVAAAPSSPLMDPADAAADSPDDALDASAPARTATSARPFELLRFDEQYGGEPGPPHPSGYLIHQFFPDCHPTPLAGYHKATPPGGYRDDGQRMDLYWEVGAFRCDAPIVERYLPDPWLSDGSFFLWGHRGTLLIEVHAHQRTGPPVAAFRRWITRALAASGEPETAPPDVPVSDRSPPPDRKQVEAMLARWRKIVFEIQQGGSCLSGAQVQAEWSRLGGELSRVVPQAPGVLEEPLRFVIQCRECMPRANLDCLQALRNIDYAAAWIRKNGR